MTGPKRESNVAAVLAWLLGLPAIGVVAFIGCVAAFSGVDARGAMKVERAQRDLRTLAEALTRYRSETGTLPTPEQGLTSLVERNELKALPVDPWGTPYRYEIVDGRAAVVSRGSDGDPGGEDDAADLRVDVGARP